ncbi:adenosine receptor A1-like [Haliotis cracherodii]|uniref:adenosine receptor A1-like n=1 Tax=Haliotis cracherodii TaxID=6455 RepID=UPI0039E88F56
MTTNTTQLLEGVPAVLDVIFLTYYYGMFLLIACVNVPGNILVIVTVLRHEPLRQPCNYYISSLAVSDLILGFVYPLYNISHIGIPAITCPLGKWSVCRILVSQVLALEICSSYHLVAITVTRYIAIVHPLRYHHYITTRSTAIWIPIIWVLSEGIAVAQYTFYDPVDYKGICRYELIFSLHHVGILFVIQLFLPLTVMVGLYCKIARIARRHAKVMSLHEPPRPSPYRISVSRSSSIFGREVKSTIMVSILLFSFAVGWTPMVIYFFVSIACETCHVNRYIRASARILLYMTSAVNIFIYAGRLGDFREFIRRDLRKTFRCVVNKLQRNTN